jgi:transposase
MYVRQLSEEEGEQLQAGLHSSNAFVLRRCQILLASASGERTPQIGRNLGCATQTVRNVIRAFHEQGLACLKEGSRRAHHLPHTAFAGDKGESLRLLLHQSRRHFGKDRSVWTLALLAEVSFEQGLTPRQVSAEAVRATLVRLGVRFQRAKEWIESPDLAYQRKKAVATD